jgi:hypothetical protein
LSSSSRSVGPASIRKPGCDQLFASPRLAGEPRARNHAGTLGADVVAALRNLPQMIN